MKKVLKVGMRKKFWKTKFYPANREAVLFTKIAGTKALTYEGLENAIRLGFGIKIINAGYLKDIVIEDIDELNSLVMIKIDFMKATGLF